MSTIVVTGANRGIGLELCKQLSARGDTVIAVCRSASRELAALKVRVVDGIDVGDAKSVATLAAKIPENQIDVLVNNAGILERGDLNDLNFEGIARQLEVNSVGPLRVTNALLPKLGVGSKIAIITSLMGSIADNGSGGMYGYRMSKAAVNAAGKSLALDLKSKKIAVALLHPGMVATEMTGGAGISAEESVHGLLARLDALTLANSGTFWHQNGKVLPW